MASHAVATQSYEPSAAMPPAPKQIGRFEVRSEIGRGSNGVVYAAFDPVLGREVAIKAIPLAADNQVRRRAEASFLQEAKSAASLNHPGIVTVFDAGKTDAVAYIAMERLYGGDLHDWLATRNRLSPKTIASMMARVADAVHYAHRRGLIHRDLKPSNIFLTRDMKPKVLDFGVALAQYSDTPLTANRQLIGTPNYMSPEQALGRALDVRSDVFSMGAILYELLTGQRAFDGKQVEETLTRVASQPPTPIYQLNPDVPADLIEIVHRALAKDASERYQSAAEMRNDLVMVAAREDSGRLPTLTPETPVPVLNRRSVRLVVATLAVSVSIVILALEQPRRPSGASQPTPAPVAITDDSAPGAAGASSNPGNGSASAEPAHAATHPDIQERAVSVLPAFAPRPATRVRTKPVPVIAAAPAPVPPPAPTPAPDGSVMLGIAPWGEIIVDGEPHGVSPPLTRLALAPGTHTIEVRNGGAPPFIERIDLQPGQAVEVRHRF
ncbi:MAG TPA: serine/threonine-protein kinase [Burkholderiaceae bacterium]|jgi:serine/threonine protein kinase|nr:serine/threonine-protein kinase [Burkholderiaceae bacterium]